MNRLHDAFDVLVDRGDPLGAEVVWGRALDEAENGPVIEMQPERGRDRGRFRIVAVAALCIAIAAAAIGFVSQTRDNTKPAARFPSTVECRAKLGTQTKSAVLPFVNGAHVTITIARAVVRFSLAFDAKTQRGSMKAVLSGPGLDGTSSVAGINRQRSELQHRQLKMSDSEPLPFGMSGASRSPGGIYGYECGTPWYLAFNAPSFGVM